MGARTKQKKHLSFTALKTTLSAHFNAIPDLRQPGKCVFLAHDVLMSAFACMYFQEPSLLQFQRRMEQGQGKNNCRTLFGVESIPQDTQLRDTLDTIPGTEFAGVFKDYFERLRRHKHLEAYAILPNVLLCAIDGTQYHSSKNVHCNSCLSKEHKTGEITYSHSVLQGAIMHPDKKQVLPVMPEAIQNTDGSKKQDCESKAAHPRQPFMMAGDGLMSHQPMIETVKENGMHYVFVAKPGDHAYLFEWLDAFDTLPTREVMDDKGRCHRYRWQNAVPLHGQKDAIRVNFFEYSEFNKKGERTYRNSWVTDIVITHGNVETMTKAGRCRWKIENECFNTLKNQGYHIEHNYGHGKQHLSFNMYLFTLLAFYFHQIFELTDGAYQACRRKLGSKRYMWEVFRGSIRQVVFSSWVAIMDSILNPDDWEVICVKKS